MEKWEMTDAGNVVTLGMLTKAELPVERVLTAETAMALTEVIVLGWREDGTMHLAMSDPGLDRALMLLALAQRRIVAEAEAMQPQE
jgi:hypothetical protein